jgi:hypothetical protein
MMQPIRRRFEHRLHSIQRPERTDMPNIDWKWFLVGAAVGYFAVPYAMNLVKSRG